jgi:hypothetical protein
MENLYSVVKFMKSIKTNNKKRLSNKRNNLGFHPDNGVTH